MHPSEPERFEGCDHEDLADNIKLKFFGRGTEPCKVNANEVWLSIKKFNSRGHNTRSILCTLTFGRICAFAGDFYGIPDQPVTVEGETELGQITVPRRQRAVD